MHELLTEQEDLVVNVANIKGRIEDVLEEVIKDMKSLAGRKVIILLYTSSSNRC